MVQLSLIYHGTNMYHGKSTKVHLQPIMVVLWSPYHGRYQHGTLLPGAAWAGPEARQAAASKLACVCASARTV